jgi:hypothetical protein
MVYPSKNINVFRYVSTSVPSSRHSSELLIRELCFRRLLGGLRPLPQLYLLLEVLCHGRLLGLRPLWATLAALPNVFHAAVFFV